METKSLFLVELYNSEIREKAAAVVGVAGKEGNFCV